MSPIPRMSENQRSRVATAFQSNEWHADETIWTYFIASLLCDDAKYSALAPCFGMPKSSSTSLPWVESQPISPRTNEGNSHIDLALGSIRERGNPEGSGIEYDDTSALKIACFVEAKVFSDCSIDVTNDPHRNQIARVIEVALTFQTRGTLLPKPVFILLTPRAFKDRKPASRFYAYLFERYNKDRLTLHTELRSSSLEKRANKYDGWIYPTDTTLRERCAALEMRWITYEDLIEKVLPDYSNLDLTTLSDAPIRDKLRQDVENYACLA